MKMAKKLVAVLLAGVLALSVLTACSGGAGPLTKDNVTDYIIDYYKVKGYQAEEEQSMESAAQAVLEYVNSKIGESKYNGMALQEAFSAIIEDADEETRKGWMNSVTLKEGYNYCVNCASVNETYRTDLFNQGKTALIAAALASEQDQCEIFSYFWEQAPERWPSDAGVCVIEGAIGGKECMVSMLRMPSRAVYPAHHYPNKGDDNASGDPSSDATTK